MAAESGGTCQPVQLEPFIHQVGGSSSMLRLDDYTLCKPLIPRELDFYESLPEKLKKFTPEYKGIIEVKFTEDSDGYVTLAAYPPQKVYHQGLSLSDGELYREKHGKNRLRHSEPSRIRLCQSGTIEIESEREEKDLTIFEEGDEPDKRTKSIHNPWVLRCHREQLVKMHATASASKTSKRKFILLENLTSRFKYPCILDLKMGTRQHGDDASLAKQKSHEAKVALTTSGSLGVRICGMQVYQLNSGRFLCHNKYYGRSLTVDGFKQAFRRFLHNGQHIRLDVIPLLLDRLDKLYTVIEHLDTFRFYTSSLLIIYDGKKTQDVTSWNGNQDAGRMVHDQIQGNGNDYLNDDFSECERSLKMRENVGAWGKPLDSCYTDVTQTLSSFPWERKLLCPIDVRMIDFAHSTHCELPSDRRLHEGPDEGYLFGLQNVIALLKTILQEEG